MLAATWIVAIDPVLAWQSRFIMTETLTALPERGGSGRTDRAMLARIGAGRCPPGPGQPLAAQHAARRGTGRHCRLAGRSGRVLRSPGSLRDDGLTLILVLSPWAIRNALIFGEPVWTTTHGGYTLALANNEVYYRDVLNGPPGSVWMGHDQWLWWDSVNRETSGMSEPQADRFLKNRVIELAFAQPYAFLRAGLQRLGRFWSLAPALSPSTLLVRWATAAWTLPLWIALGLGLARRSLMGLAPDRRTAADCRSEPGSRLLLDGPANACTHRAGDRTGGRVGRRLACVAGAIRKQATDATADS